MSLSGHASHGAACTGQHVNGGEMMSRCKLTRQVDVAIEYRAHLIADRVDIFLLEQYRVERGHRSAVAIASALEQSRQGGEHGRWIASPSRRFTYGEPHVTQCTRESCC